MAHMDVLPILGIPPTSYCSFIFPSEPTSDDITPPETAAINNSSESSASTSSHENDAHFTATPAPRQAKAFIPRRPHTKSRGGCLNCKKDRRKCDESKPGCKRCDSRNIACEYDGPGSKKQAQAASAALVKKRQMPQSLASMDCSPLPTTVSLIDDCLREAELASSPTPGANEMTFSFSVAHLQILHFFSETTCWSLVNPSIWRELHLHTVRLAMKRTYLMHTVITLAQMHHQWLTGGADLSSPKSTRLWQHALTAYNRRLSKPVTCEDADAIFLTSTLMNAISFAIRPAARAAESWPMQERGDDLQWLFVQSGPAQLLEQIGPWLVDGVLKPGFAEFDDEFSTYNDMRPGIAGLPRPFVELCELTPESDWYNNPYHKAVRFLTPLLKLQRTPKNSAKFLNFVGNLTPAFLELLKKRDARALLLLGYWYALVAEVGQWWLMSRAKNECASICMFLSKHPDPRIKGLLAWPARASGYDLDDVVGVESIARLLTEEP